ncbi:MAG: phosphate ABC transporter permease subunit PstC [Candidatus Saganbacteria bacterium]|nr:phosphate ABC transporter permease subunit PstC [Candidatus Saganbacteria bacterium]
MKRPFEYIIEKLVLLSGIASIVFVVLIFAFLLKEGLSLFANESVFAFLFGRNWYPISDPPQFGILPLILGSLLVTFGAIVIAVPLGLAAAIYVAEIAPLWLRDILKSGIELLAAIPSIVLGFIGIVTLAPFLKTIFNLPSGLTALAGSIMLAFMAMPTIVSIIEDSIVSVPKNYKEGSLALGATRWQTIYRVTLPAASSGILAAIMLGIGRVVGETMAVLMITGNAAVMPVSFLQPVRTLTATIAAEMGEAVGGSGHYYALFAIGIVLFVISFIINLLADMFLHRGRGRKRR